MFYGKFADEGDNLVNNPNIYNVEGDSRLPHGLRQDVLKIFFQSGSVIVTTTHMKATVHLIHCILLQECLNIFFQNSEQLYFIILCIIQCFDWLFFIE
jgi:hypothetical protein